MTDQPANDATLISELRTAGQEALDRGVAPEDVARALCEIFVTFAAAVQVTDGISPAVHMVTEFCETAHYEVGRRARQLQKDSAP